MMSAPLFLLSSLSLGGLCAAGVWIARLREQLLRSRVAARTAADATLAADAALREKIARLERKLEHSNGELEAVQDELASLSYSISHDLRAPLRSIDGFSEALLEDYGASLEGTARDYLQRVRANAVRMMALIEDLLALSRATRSEIRLEWIDLSALVSRLAGALSDSEPLRSVKWEIQPGIGAVGDRGLIECALRHLLANAWKFTSRHSTASIGFHIRPGATSLEPVYEVADDGVGFDMRYAGRLFGAFQRMHSSEEFPGTGIGLASVQRIIRRHGGRVWAEAVVGQGARFLFTLPEARAVAVASPVALAPLHQEMAAPLLPSTTNA